MSARRNGPWTLLVPGGLALALWLIGSAGTPRQASRSVLVAPLFPPGATRFVPAAGGEPVPVAALTLTLGRGPSYFYARSKGLWRCLNAGGALCEEATLLELFDRLQRARGLIEGQAPDLDLDALGFAPERLLRLDLHGPAVLKEGAQKDILGSVELGQPKAGLGGPARLAESTLILELSEDLLPRLASGGARGELPPLVSTRALPAPWPGWAAGIARVFVDPAEGQGFELIPLEPDPDAPVAPGLERFLIRRPDGSEVQSNPVLGTGFFLFLSRAPRVALPQPADLPQPEQRQAALQLTLVSKDGSLLEVAILRGFGPGRRVLIEDFAGSASLIEPEVARLLGPTADELVNGGGNPWDPYLR